MENQQPSSTEATQLLAKAAATGERVHTAVTGPYVAFMLALGVTTAFGTFAMGLLGGDAFTAAYLLTIGVTLGLVVFFTVSIQQHAAFARGRRWVTFIAAWAISYMVAILLATLLHGSLLAACVGAGLILVVSFAFAVREVRA